MKSTEGLTRIRDIFMPMRKDTGALSFALVFLPAAILFCVGTVSDITVPGVYMDAVNPDYLVVRLFHPEALNTPYWSFPENVVFDRFPVLGGNFYYGALPFYLGAPVYALAGTGVVGIRVANMVFGLLVLAATAIFLRAFRVRPVIAAMTLAMLALDPGFLFSFRTQFYITLLPVAPLLLSVALAESRGAAATRRVAIWSGALAGIACYGYFIYGFLVPTVAVHAAWRWRALVNRRSLVSWWGAGFALAVSPYVIGAILALAGFLVEYGGLREFRQYLTSDLGALDVSSSVPLLQRFQSFFDMVRNTIRDVGPAGMMLQEVPPLCLPTLKTTLLVDVPVFALIGGLIRSPRLPGLPVLAGFILGFLVLVLAFGDRLWLHHAALLLPVLYAALALALEWFVAWMPPRWARIAGWGAAAVLSPFLLTNALDRHAVFERLRATGGVGLSSDAILRFAEESLRVPSPTRMFFPDWGVFMSFVMITRGSIPFETDFSPEAARAALCGGQDAVVVLVTGKPIERLPIWINEVGWGKPDISTYNQRDGTPVLTVGRWRAAERPAGACQG
jgi:hypothetical protein